MIYNSQTVFVCQCAGCISIVSFALCTSVVVLKQMFSTCRFLTVHLNSWFIFFLSEIHRSYCQFFSSALSQGLAHKQPPEPKTVHVDLKAMLWTDSSLGCAGTSECDCAHVHVCENVSYVSAGGRFYQWHIQYTHTILITQFDIQMRGETSHHFTHLHSSHHICLKAQSVCTSVDASLILPVNEFGLTKTFMRMSEWELWEWKNFTMNYDDITSLSGISWLTELNKIQSVSTC